MLRRLMLSLLAIVFAAAPFTTAAQNQDAEEPEIRRVIENIDKAINKEDLKLLPAQYSDDAMIDSKIAGTKVNKQKFEESVAKAFKAHDIIKNEYRDVKVTVADPTHATALSTVYAITRTNRFTWLLEWKLEKRDGRWVVVETNYK
jgi:ketosteroid isomerase-like protein